MIVREVLDRPELIESMDLFNDARDTVRWLRSLDTTEALKIALQLQIRYDDYGPGSKPEGEERYAN